MIFKNICAKKSYKTKQGEEKVAWLNVGTLKESDNGKQYIELNMFPGLDLYVFDQKPKKDDLAYATPVESINLDEAPF